MRHLGWIIQDDRRALEEYRERLSRRVAEWKRLATELHIYSEKAEDLFRNADHRAQQAEIDRLKELRSDSHFDFQAYALDCFAETIDLTCPACGFDHEDDGPTMYVPTPGGAHVRCRDCGLTWHRLFRKEEESE